MHAHLIFLVMLSVAHVVVVIYTLSVQGTKEDALQMNVCSN